MPSMEIGRPTIAPDANTLLRAVLSVFRHDFHPMIDAHFHRCGRIGRWAQPARVLEKPLVARGATDGE